MLERRTVHCSIGLGFTPLRHNWRLPSLYVLRAYIDYGSVALVVRGVWYLCTSRSFPGINGCGANEATDELDAARLALPQALGLCSREHIAVTEFTDGGKRMTFTFPSRAIHCVAFALLTGTTRTWNVISILTGSILHSTFAWAIDGTIFGMGKANNTFSFWSSSWIPFPKRLLERD